MDLPPNSDLFDTLQRARVGFGEAVLRADQLGYASPLRPRRRPATGIFEFLAIAFMPSDKQRTLYERLHKKFGDLPEWEQYTKDRAIEEMSPHLAFHFLQMLLWNLAGKDIPSTCPCVVTTRGALSAHRNEHPPLATVGARKGALV
jgi:hypothetical protein